MGGRVLVPIPTDRVDETISVWGHWLAKVAGRGGVTIDGLLNELRLGTTQVHVIWDDANKEATAIVGTCLKPRHDGELWCEMTFCAGVGREDWFHLIEQLERWAAEHIGCAGMRAFCRPGWAPELKRQGYRETHRVMDKRLKGHGDGQL